MVSLMRCKGEYNPVKINYFSACGHIYAEKLFFLDMLKKSGLYAFPLTKKEKKRILSMSSMDFKEDFSKRYYSQYNARAKKFRYYTGKVKEYTGKRGAFESKLKEEKKNRGEASRLKVLENLLYRSGEKVRHYRDEQRKCKSAKSWYKEIMDMVLNDMLGKHPISPSFKSYLAAQKDFEDEVRKYSELKRRARICA